MEQERQQKRRETAAQIAAQFPIPKWYDMSLPSAPNDANGGGDHLPSPMKQPRLSRLNTSVQLHADAIRQHIHTAGVVSMSSAQSVRRRSTMSALHPKRSIPTLPQLPPPASDQFGLWPLASPPRPTHTLQKSMSSIDMFHAIKSQSPPPRLVDHWAEPAPATRGPLHRPSHVGSAGKLRHLSSIRSMSRMGSITDNNTVLEAGSSDMINDDNYDTPLETTSDGQSNASSDDGGDEEDIGALLEPDGHGAMVAVGAAPPLETILSQDESPEDTYRIMPKMSARAQAKEMALAAQRRQTMTDIVAFADAHLRKKIFKGWEHIDFAFKGGDLNQMQVERVLQTQGISVTMIDVARVHQVIDEYFAQQDAIEAMVHGGRSNIVAAIDRAVGELASNEKDDAPLQSAPSPGALDTVTPAIHVRVDEPETIRKPIEPPERKVRVISYKMMQDMFYPTNDDDIKAWGAELEAEKARAAEEKAARDLQLHQLEEKIKRRLASTAQGMLRVLARFDFVHMTWSSAMRKETTTALFFKTIFRKKKTLLEDQVHDKPEKARSITVIYNALLQTYARNRGLDELDLDDAAQVFHDVAANAIQNGARQYFARKATFYFPERQAFFALKLKKRVFRGWFDRAHQLASQRQRLFRKFVAWRYLVTLAKRYREMFRICFWPYYVWKRHVQFVLISRSKANFLRLVFESYVQLRILRGLRRYTMRRNWCRAQVNLRTQARHRAMLERIFAAWRKTAAVTARLQKIWEKRGLSMHWQNKFYLIRITMHLWRYYTILRRDIARRQYLCYHGVLGKKNDAAWEAENDAVPLTRLMESHLGSKIKLKSFTHELGIAMYIKYRKKDRQAILAQALVFKRIAPLVFRAFVVYREHKKRGRFATELGLFRLYAHHFATLVRFLLYRKHQEALRRASTKRFKELVLQDQIDHVGGASTTTPGEPPKVETKRALQWRQDREWREAGLAQAAVDAAALEARIHALYALRRESHARFDDRETKLREWKEAEARVQHDEEAKSTGMRSQLHHCASQILHTRVRRLYETICRTFDVLQDKYNHMLLKSTFRMLRLPRSNKHATVLCHRAQLRNWIRLAHCYSSWADKMPRYHTLKLLWSMWKKWIEYIRNRALYESPGLARKMQRRRMLVSKFENYLIDQEFMLIPTVLGKKLSYNSYKAVFVRWVEWAQLTFATNAMVATFRTRSAIRRKGQVFLAWKIQLKAKYIALPHFVVEKRSTADIERVRSSLWNKRKHLVSRRIRRVLSACDRKLKLSVCSNPTLKHLFAMHSKDIMKRLNLENRLMFVAYNERQVHHYEERQSALMGGQTGHKFDYVEAIPFGHIRQVNVICGKSVDGIAITIKSFSDTVEGAIHGNPFGNSSLFVLTPSELLTSIEGYATQSTILALRFGTNQSRFSKWYGRTDAGLPFHLDAAQGEEIVGLHGFAAKDSVHGLGVCFRKTTERNVFEGLWIEHPNLSLLPGTVATDDTINHCDRQFSYFLQMRSCDVYAAMDRSHKLALRMWRSESIPDAVRRLRIVMGVCRWFFNALVHGLVALTDREDEGRRILQDGLNIRASGEKLLVEGEAIMELVDKYREGRKKQLNLTLLGFKKIQELRHNMEVGDDKIKRGKALVADGNAEILRGKQLLPKIPLTDRMLDNIRSLYRVVQTKDSMDAMSESIKKLLLSEHPIDSDTTLVDMKEVAEANENAAFDMGQARAEVVSSKLRETLSQAIT
ncbi:Aste57867_18765 [Aphanomyces stellatus]|uniref:Aste57867_18765 protein n=1 Tax=Aphanomyces stellatus TaxID=120398 RepID=A0A485LF06_9STRA|nr:hypothetical protein As57867_018701 [Aphanomyces stellatus]VFT95499.1 Aste57867_18765 [Aphanomyces stellatus]